MKLIDLLVQELPRRGGWPDGVNFLEQYTDGSLFCGDTYQSLIRFDRVDDFGYDGVTREQYEAALAASQRCVHEWIPSEGRTSSGVLCRKCGDYDGPGEDEKMKESNSQVWDGEGFPPVGCECEFFDCEKWFKVTMMYGGSQLVVLYDHDNQIERSFSTSRIDGKFRPIRSEADRKRDEAIAALKKLKPQLVGELAGSLYDEIAAGKIPHIRIEHAA
ncbi:hypothetical protein [Cronobacter malonaticus]|uniref:hypothetical protein n=1 Tax=Cronobacter malonaticus TaxID=413503 RepID=UPI0024AF4E69|nr:hypothetical protein [Cronobacter malonaticus]MDI7687794.1 hypothetical protein [Cronobacter malonaticus]MDK1298952.1 hypothetical protein [Cronobacter malonaticus]